MRFLFLRCGALDIPMPAEAHDLSAVPTRKELALIDAFLSPLLPTDPTPSLDDIAAQPDVRHLGAPEPAPQAPHLTEPARIVIAGSDAALSAVLTRLMRSDRLWAEVAFIPVPSATSSSSAASASATSAAAQNWGLPTSPAEALDFARTAPVRPAPLIRNDSGLAVAGSATISDSTNSSFTGEIIIDDHTLAASSPKTFGARLVPMTDAPGILAARATSPVESQGRLRSLLRKPGQLDPESVRTGRAVQAGGPQLRVIVDSVAHKRPVTRVTFYRHLRDLQIVRP
ncbi:hypothetical protein [Corynebacterium tuberculostearicum]|uniref:hypothetical protein n=1 Tax=Corynebacterium tuberculostearicum TaxID=38304 RepID=UPI002647FF37|nr:hypothetical protein [Corynebacterium tuberculostearicum]WKE58679.1 hypothetical protein KAH61_06500 [Corynebacterium tuberculostearicum]